MYQFMMKFCLRTCSVMDSMSQQDHCYLEGDLTVVWGISWTTLFCYVALLSPWEKQNLFLKRLPSQILFIKWLPAQTRPLFPSLDQRVLLFPSLAQRGPLFPSLTQRVLLFQSLAQKLYQSMTSAPCLFPLMISVLCLLQPRNKAPCSLLNSLDCWISQKWINFRSSSSPTFAPEFTPVHASAPESAPVYESDPESAPVPPATSVAEPPLTVAELFTALMVFPVTYVPTTDSPCFLEPLLQPQVPSLNSLYPLKLLLLPLQNLQRWWRPLQNI